ncbi:MAG: GDSL-type esterase/lipase family protein [Bacteroidales bacterium]|jgi:lysophospholipase L1-like esterase|nr:GDSL-type esterase/lipase family protein [Bacteroidales bacterium]
MKVYKIVAFIFLIITALAFLCLFFPEDGIAIGSFRLRFPSLENVMSGSHNSETMDVDELLKKSELAQFDSVMNLHQDTIAFFVNALKYNAARFYFPNDDYSYFDPLFQSMSHAQEEGSTVRIMHYGDSQIEVDRLSANIRAFFQSKFGGIGPGLLPLEQNIPSTAIYQSVSGNVLPYAAYGEIERRKNGNYGLMAKCFAINGDVVFNATGANNKYADSLVKQFSNVKLLLMNKGSSFSATLKDRKGNYDSTITLKEGAGLRVIEWQLPKNSTQIRLSLHGNADIYGIALDGAGGVAVDNIPLRGCSGTIFTRISDSLLAKSYQVSKVKLIILQFGGNAMPGNTNEQAVATYKKRVGEQIQFLKEVYPEAKMLFIGPSDMSNRYRGEMQTYHYLPETVQALKEVSLENGIAFWNLYEVMGGENSMLTWVRSGLAGSDYVHFTPSGALKVGGVLTSSFQIMYDWYLMRQSMPAAQFEKLWKEVESNIVQISQPQTINNSK